MNARRLATYGKSCSYAAWTEALRAHEAINTQGGACLRAFNTNSPSYGAMPPEARELLDSDPSVTYVVFSYDTPIAWYSEITGQWVIPDVKYSVTTSKHVGLIRFAIGQLEQFS